MTRVLVATSDAQLRESLVTVLRGHDLDTLVAVDGLVAFREVFREPPDAVLLDLAISEVDGLEWVRMVRAASPVAIVALLAPGEHERGVKVLDYGADDVVQPSTGPGELVARLKAATRRSQRSQEAEPQRPPVVRTGGLVIDFASQTVTKDGRRVPLSRTEYRLLEALASCSGQVAPHRFLLTTVWGGQYVDDVHYLRVYVGYLRAKLEDEPSSPEYIRSEWGVGYRLVIIDPWRGESLERQLGASPADGRGPDERRLGAD